MIKVIASDMDGTLLNEKHEISEESIASINKAGEAGITFVISTGREYSSVETLLKNNNIRCQCVLMNGAEYRDENGNIVETINIEKSTARKIIDIMKEAKLTARIFTNKGVYTIESKEEALKEVAYRTQSFDPNLTLEEAIELAKKQPYFIQLKYVKNIDEFFNSDIEVRKFVAFHKDIETINKMKKILGDIEGLAVSSSFIDNIEITDVRAQKGIILAKVAHKMGINKDEVLVLGDSFNDYSMFTEFTESVAMGNAIPEIKKIAKYITDTNANNGVAKAIYKVIEQQK
ncbi:Cof-type HAD-IIB family hydrolase [Clostridium uliginosum]|uniref:Cof subfamily of IIB subfamily of haloacid dehalogenase superfamily/HAD-superfamily hydrolase, subfamily IIB n=1 Tax=Clostridium uliginosum TaxID=119641 RepID=A0A1I1N0L9_9CLOT|nr:Cof-type HAD-IIB family hydrolase [Clostridium uliginosum]SFC91191.1 hypothetical protein SAMN05421842_11338 [Clostridium uliginosum]